MGDNLRNKYIKKGKIANFLLVFLIFNLFFLPSSKVFAYVDIVGKYAISMDARTGEVLFEKDAYENDKVYPASVTKVLTALMLVENIKAEEEITLSKTCVGQVRSNSQIFFSEGEKMDRDTALYAMMVISANDVACAIGEHIAGTEREFGKMMTERAKELGAVNSKFYTASGLHHPGHYTSAYDLALIGKKAIEYDIILDAMGTKKYTITTSEQTKEIINPSKIHNDPDALGGKTGYTDAARNTLMKIDEIDNKRVINVVLRSNLYHIYDDIKKISNHAISKLDAELVVDEKKWSKTLTFYDKEVLIKPEKTLFLTKKKDDIDTFNTTFIQTENFTREFLELHGIQKGMKVGEIEVTLGDKVVHKVNVLSTQDVFFEKEKQAIVPFWLKIILATAVPLLSYTGFVVFYNKKYNRKYNFIEK